MARFKTALSGALAAVVAGIVLGGCAAATATTATPVAARPAAPSPDPRVGLGAGLWDAAQASWNMRLISNSRPPEGFQGQTNSDLAFIGNYAVQGNYHGILVWDISNPASPTLRKSFVCPASQNDVSIYRNLLFVSAEGLSSRLDCGTAGVRDTLSPDRVRGVRIIDVSDWDNPRNVASIQTCRGSHTHTLLVDPRDSENVYVYVSGSAGVRSPNELAGCVADVPENDPNSALFRIEVIKVPLANPQNAAIVSSPRIFENLAAPPRHGEAPEDAAARMRALEQARAQGHFIATIFGSERPLPPPFTAMLLDSLVKARGGTGAPTSADSATLRREIQGIVDRVLRAEGVQRGPTQCHDITVYPALGLGGGACEGYGFLLDIRDPVNPVRIAEVADSNFSYWHSATFNNDGTKVLFSDEWGGGGQPKCRASDPPEWGANAIFSIENRQMRFGSYYKIPAPQTAQENCVAHNGSLIPVPGRDIMVQAWYQGGVSVFDWTDPARPVEIAFFDRGPVNATRMDDGGAWSSYWYNGVIVSSEISRGLDVLELTPNPWLTQNEIDAAKTVRLDHFNAQGQPQFVWPASFAVARAYVDQLERSGGLAARRIATLRAALGAAERQSGTQRQSALTRLASEIDRDASGSRDAARVRMLGAAVREIASAP